MPRGSIGWPAYVHEECLSPKMLSESNPLLVTLHWGSTPTRNPTWRLYPTALEDAAHRNTIVEELGHYFKTNEGSTEGTSNEWEAFKVLCGVYVLRPPQVWEQYYTTN